MPILHVRSVPEELYERIRQQAQSQGRSISAEVIVLLERALNESAQPQGEILGNIRRRRVFRPSQAGAPDSLTILQKDRSR
jgi:antitoxin FitA